MILKSLNGIYPRSEKFISVTRDFERKRVGSEELFRALEEEREEFFRLQRGLDFHYDGLIGWSDLVRPFALILHPCRVNGLKRYFETNFFYRTLIFERKPTLLEKDLPSWYERHFIPPRNGGKPFAYLPSPTLFRTFSQGLSLSSIAEILREILTFLKDKGFQVFWFADPSSVSEGLSREDKEVLQGFYHHAKKVCDPAYLFLQTYFAPIGSLKDFFFRLEVDALGVDFFRNTPRDLSGWPKEMGLIAGCVDTENAVLENPSSLKKFLMMLRKKLSPRFISITGNADWELLPRKIADEKVKVLKEVGA